MTDLEIACPNCFHPIVRGQRKCHHCTVIVVYGAIDGELKQSALIGGLIPAVFTLPLNHVAIFGFQIQFLPHLVWIHVVGAAVGLFLCVHLMRDKVRFLLTVGGA